MMVLNPDEFERYQHSPNARLLNDALRTPVEQIVSDFYSRKWAVKAYQDMNDFASHLSAILSDGEKAVFVKLSEAANGLDQFEVELDGLRFLADQAGILTPTPIGNVPVEGGVIMVLEAVQAVERGPREWRQIGRTLATIHEVKGDRYGFDRQGYFGPLYQDNRPMDDWLGFYIERRIWPRLMGAIDSGHMTTEAIRLMDKLIARLPHLEIPEILPSLLHGDAQQNNFISTLEGAMVIDPAVYYGNPEMDLAYVDFFQPVPDGLFMGYQEVLPIDPGFAERKELWRVSAYLAMVMVMGASQLEQLIRAVKKYL